MTETAEAGTNENHTGGYVTGVTFPGVPAANISLAAVRVLLTAALWLVLASCLAADGSQLTGRRVSSGDGLASNNINCIAQDADGYIWFGTSNGLSRFDGYSAVTFTNLSPVAGESTDRHIGGILMAGDTMTVRTANYGVATYSLSESRFTGYKIYSEGNVRPQRLFGHDVLARLPYRGDTLCVSGNTVYRIARDGRVISKYPVPAAVGAVWHVEVSLVWGHRLVIMTGGASYMLDMATGRFSRPDNLQMSRPTYQGDTPGCKYVSNGEGDLWMFFDDGTVRKFHLLDNARYVQNRRHQFYPADDGNGRIFIATYGNGLFVYDKATGGIARHSAGDASPVIYSDFLTCAMADRSGNVWIGSEAAGAVCISAMRGISARYVYLSPSASGETANHIYSLEAAPDGSVLAGTRENRTLRFNPADGTVSELRRLTSPAFCFMTDSSGRTWTGTRGAGVLIDGKQYSSRGGQHRIPASMIHALAEAPRGRYWIATWGSGLLCATLGADGSLGCRRVLGGSHNERHVRCLAVSAGGILWAGTDNGLYSMPVSGRQALTCYNLQNRRLRGNEISSMHYSAASGLWLGVHGHGLAQCVLSGGRVTEVRYFDAAHGLADDIVYSITEDRYGNIWAATEEGISCVSPRTRSVVTYNFSASLMGNVFTENSAASLPDGRLLFGTRSGILEIVLTADPTAQRQSRCFITDLRVNGVSVLTMDSLSRPLSASLSRTREITLSHSQNSLTLYFSDFDYSRPRSTLYQYMLEGSDDDWRGPTSLNHAGYGDLPPGHYTFRLRKYTPGGNAPETVLRVTVSQPWYNTWTAWLIYMAVAAAACLVLWREWRSRFLMRRRMEIERHLNEFRANFFTHVTHEFRTPLAIIQSSMDRISACKDTVPPRSAVSTAMRGTRRLARLVDKIMDFRKINADSMRLRVERGDVVAFVREVFQDFWSAASQKEIALTFTPFARNHEMLFDRQMLETIVYNLLSNAVKYTPQKGSVALAMSLREADRMLIITVRDTGPGISDSQAEHLFEPFMHGYVSQGGMGIGLYLACRMAGLHHGSLSYVRPDGGAGAEFRVEIPSDDEAYGAGEIGAGRARDAVRGLEADGLPETEVTAALNDIRVAIVEDDPDMMLQLKSGLGNYFRVDAYMTGREAIDGIVSSPPSLVICDVMLPDISGYDVVRHIKKNPATCRLQVIMLTALDDEAHQIKGYNAGADDYMVKPCNMRVLLARAVQLIKWSAAPAVPDGGGAGAPAVITSQADRRFKEAIDTLIAQHLQDEDFTVDVLASLMRMGRTKLYGKMKELTGMPPNKYFMKIRMETAARLIAEGGHTVFEVAMKVGIQEQSYFYRCFKSYYGVAPSRYGK